MMAIKAQRDEDEIPVGMRRVCRRFERWRKGQKARLPIPEKLWALAAQVAREHGVFRTAKVLRLEYGKLKRMAEGVTPSARAASAGSAFLELVSPQTVGLSECVIESEGPRGKLRIQWKGATASDLAGLIRAWESV